MCKLIFSLHRYDIIHSLFCERANFQPYDLARFEEACYGSGWTSDREIGSVQCLRLFATTGGQTAPSFLFCSQIERPAPVPWPVRQILQHHWQRTVDAKD